MQSYGRRSRVPIIIVTTALAVYLKLESASAITYLARIDPVEGAEPAAPPTYTCTLHYLAMVQLHLAMPYSRDKTKIVHTEQQCNTDCGKFSCALSWTEELFKDCLGSAHSTVHGCLSQHLRRASIFGPTSVRREKSLLSDYSLQEKAAYHKVQQHPSSCNS